MKIRDIILEWNSDSSLPALINKTAEVDGIQVSINTNSKNASVYASSNGRRLGYAEFDRDGNVMVPYDLAVDDKYRGQGIAAIMYDYVKSLGFKIERSSEQTDAGKYFWDKNRGEEGRLWEGGWDTTLTQGTVLHPRIVAVALQVVDRFVADFNAYLKPHGLGPVRRGRPTGSSAHHEADTQENPDKVYGDIDLQMIGPETAGQSYGQFTAYWNKLADDFVKQGHAPYVDTSESKAGHPIFALGNNQFVQVDFMWHPERLEQWGASRVTPERGVKGLLHGNMFSVLGELLDLSIQHAGVQLKVQDGQHVPFSKQKDTEVVTVTTSPTTFIYDTFMYLAKNLGIKNPKVSPLLKQNPGNDVNDVKISKLVQGIKGFAESCDMNDMFGQGDLAGFLSGQDFLTKFLQRYDEKAQIDIAGKKRDKATTPDAIARANSDREKIQQGLDMVKGYFK